MPHIDEAFPSKYLRASDLQGSPARVVISNLAYEVIDNKRKLIMFFQGKTKGLVLNKTNATTIAAIYGQDWDNWIGGDLELYPTMVDYQGKQVDAVRCRIPPRKPAGAPAVVSGGARFMANGRDDARFAAGQPDDRFGAAPRPAVAPREDVGGGELDDEIPFAPEFR